MSKIACVVCKARFERWAKNQKCCSDECSRKNKIERRRKYLLRPEVIDHIRERRRQYRLRPEVKLRERQRVRKRVYRKKPAAYSREYRLRNIDRERARDRAYWHRRKGRYQIKSKERRAKHRLAYKILQQLGVQL